MTNRNFFLRILPTILEQAVNIHDYDRYLCPFCNVVFKILKKCLDSWKLERVIKKFWNLEATLLVEIKA